VVVFLLLLLLLFYKHYHMATYILKNIFFCVQQNKEIHTGVKQLEGGQIRMAEFSFLGELSL